jgi:hypothetical protein
MIVGFFEKINLQKMLRVIFFRSKFFVSIKQHVIFSFL